MQVIFLNLTELDGHFGLNKISWLEDVCVQIQEYIQNRRIFVLLNNSS